MKARALAGIWIALVCASGSMESWAQDTRSPDPVITRPGGAGNVSRYEYAPEDQPKLIYESPPADGDTDLFSTEVDLLRDQVRDLQNEVGRLRDENARLKAYNETLLKAQRQAE